MKSNPNLQPGGPAEEKTKKKKKKMGMKNWMRGETPVNRAVAVVADIGMTVVVAVVAVAEQVGKVRPVPAAWVSDYWSPRLESTPSRQSCKQQARQYRPRQAPHASTFHAMLLSTFNLPYPPSIAVSTFNLLWHA